MRAVELFRFPFYGVVVDATRTTLLLFLSFCKRLQCSSTSNPKLHSTAEQSAVRLLPRKYHVRLAPSASPARVLPRGCVQPVTCAVVESMRKPKEGLAIALMIRKDSVSEQVDHIVWHL